jgi:hypothetical protein
MTTMRSTAIALGIAGAMSATALAGDPGNLFTDGEFEAQAGVHWQRQEPRDDDAEGFAVGYGTFHYETGELNGFNLGLGARVSSRLHEREDGNYRDAIAKDFIVPTAFLRYTHEDLGSFTMGRQEIDLEWLNDYIEGGVASLMPMDDLELNLVWAHRQAVVDPDEIVDFDRMNGSKGLYVLDAGYRPVDWLELNPYYYRAPSLLKAAGLRATAFYEPAGSLEASTMVQIAYGNPDDDPSGGLVWLEQGLDWNGIGLYAGYLKVRSRGAGMLDTYGDQQPFEEGNQVFEPDARTTYVGADWESGPVGFEAIYGRTRYDDAGDRVREWELNLIVGYEIVENLELELMYLRVSNDDRADSYSTVKAGLVYSF